MRSIIEEGCIAFTGGATLTKLNSLRSVALLGPQVEKRDGLIDIRFHIHVLVALHAVTEEGKSFLHQWVGSLLMLVHYIGYIYVK